MAHERSLRFKDMRAAYCEFMGTPATGGFGSNEGVVLAALGNESVKSCSDFDAVRERYQLPKACTFFEAFRACFGGHRDWMHFDLATLRACHGDAFRHLQLPERVEAALERDAIAEEHSYQRESLRHSSRQEEDYVAPAAEPDAPPLELLRREGPSRRARRQRGANKRTRGCKGSRNACSRSKVARKYQDAKRAYHAAGEQLRMAGIRGELL